MQLHIRGVSKTSSNQWGPGTRDVIQRLVQAFPQARISVSTSEA